MNATSPAYDDKRNPPPLTENVTSSLPTTNVTSPRQQRTRPPPPAKDDSNHPLPRERKPPADDKSNCASR